MPETNSNVFSETTKQRVYRNYRMSNTVPTTSIEDYAKNRMQNVDGFKTKIQSHNASLSEMLNASVNGAQATAAKDAIAKAFTPQKEIDGFKNEVVNLNKIITKSRHTFLPGAIASRLHAIKADVVNKMKTQHQNEITNLENLFKDDAFVTNLATAIGMDKGQVTSVIQQSMLEQLKEAHKKALEDFEKSSNEQIKSFHEAAEKERNRFSYLRIMAGLNETKEMQQAIEMQSQLTQSHHAASITVGEGKVNLSGVNVTDLQVIQTRTGKKINHNQEDGSFSFNFSNDEKIEDVIEGIVEAIKACGHQSITMQANHTDEKEAMELGRKEYEACLRAGYGLKNPKEITINVNGQPKTAEDLFKGYSNRLATAKKEAQAQADALKSYEKLDEEMLRSRLDQMRNQQQAAPGSGLSI